ncbi:MAG: hypothetical protein MMC33_009111, partial [Icmadophila ericetorum]|nr:hypothetical protein [Icmadophila ericetorum]
MEDGRENDRRQNKNRQDCHPYTDESKPYESNIFTTTSKVAHANSTETPTSYAMQQWLGQTTEEESWSGLMYQREDNGSADTKNPGGGTQYGSGN